MKDATVKLRERQCWQRFKGYSDGNWRLGLYPTAVACSALAPLKSDFLHASRETLSFRFSSSLFAMSCVPPTNHMLTCAVGGC